MTGQEEHGADEILRLVPASGWQHLRRRPFLVARTFENHLPRLGLGDAGRHDVDADAVLRPLERQGTGQVVDACLHARIYRSPLECDDAEVRAHVDDLAASLRDHDPRGCLTGEKDALERCADGLFELLFGDVEGGRRSCPACVVHEDVHASERVLRRVHHPAHIVHFGNVGQLDDALAPHLLDLGLHLFDLVLPSFGMLGEHEVRAGLRQAEGDGAADSL